jgi:hypothetical protein
MVFLLRFYLALIFLTAFVTSAHAQFRVEQTVPANGATGVDLASTTAFGFSKNLSLSIDFYTAFPVFSEPSPSISEYQLCLQLTGPCNDGSTASPRYARFVTSHDADTDYIWVVDGIADPSGALIEPYVLHYTTAPSIGQRSVSGSVGAPLLAAAAAKSGRPSVDALRRSLQHWADVAVRSGLDRAAFGPATADAPTETQSIHAKATAYTTTRLFLLEAFDTNESGWAVRAADVISGASGSYQIDYVRGGATYWPLAVRYADPAGGEITDVGFYDANGDGEADPIDVQGTDRTGIPIQLYRYPLTTSTAGLDAAQTAANSALPGAALIRVDAGNGRRPSGTAYAWTYTFFDAASGQEALVTVDPLGVEMTVQAAESGTDQMAALPTSFVDTDEALLSVLADGGQDIVDTFPPYAITTSIQGGDLYWFVSPQDTDIPFWRVRLFGATQTRIASVTRYVDMQTGEILDATALPVELTGFHATLDGTSAVLQWTTLSETNNAGFWVEHATESSRFRNLAFVNGAGTTIDPQRYRYVASGLAPGLHRFRLRQVDTDGATASSEVVEVRFAAAVPLTLTAPRPHPITASGTVSVMVAEAGDLTVELFDALGRRVRTLHRGAVSAGAPLDMRVERGGLSSGLYFIRARIGAHQATRSVVIVN